MGGECVPLVDNTLRIYRSSPSQQNWGTDLCIREKEKKRNNRNRSQSIRFPLPRTPSTDLPPAQRSYRRRDREIILRRLVSVPHCVRSRLVDAFERFFTIRAILHRYRPTISDNFTSTCLIQISISNGRIPLPISLTVLATNTMGKFYLACRFSYDSQRRRIFAFILLFYSIIFESQYILRGK